MATLDKLFRVLIQNRMDALVMEPGELPVMRGRGVERRVTKKPLDGAVIGRLVSELAPESALPAVGEDGDRRELSYPWDGTEVRVEATWTAKGWKAVATPRKPGDETAGPLVESAAPPLAERPAEAIPPARRAAAPPPAAGPTPSPAVPPSVPPSVKAAAPAAAPPVAEVAATAAAETGSGGRTITQVEELLDLLLEREASDLHLSSQQVPRLRIHGELEPLPEFRAPSDMDLERLLFAISPERGREEFERSNDADFAYELPGRARFRVNLFRDRLGIGAVIRTIPVEIPSFEQLGLPEVLKKVAHLSKGLVLVTGPTGSGKSTTLAALVDLINRSRPDHIITIEDPIEFVHASRRCLVNQREVGVHTGSFSHALRAALREDPDIVLVGEMRDLETTSTAIETAETGHLVFGTLHTTTAPSTIERLIDQFPADRQGQIRMMLSESLFAVVAQMLLRKIGGGRVAAFEILLATPAVSNLIREGKTFQIASVMQTGRGLGMRLLNESLLELVEKKIVEPMEAYRKSAAKEELLKQLVAKGFSIDPAKGDA